MKKKKGKNEKQLAELLVLAIKAFKEIFDKPEENKKNIDKILDYIATAVALKEFKKAKNYFKTIIDTKDRTKKTYLHLLKLAREEETENTPPLDNV